MADRLSSELINAGFIVQRYDAYSTDSIYLKLDYGMCNSIRISNHNGKKYLNYKYNLRSDIKTFKREKNDYTRYYYPFKKVKKLIQDIICDRQEKINKHGEQEYFELMKIEKQLKHDTKGFWSKAYLVNKEEQ